MRFLTYNTQLIPLIPEEPKFTSGFQAARMADLFVNFIQDYDVVALQEVWGILSCELKEIFVCYA